MDRAGFEQLYERGELNESAPSLACISARELQKKQLPPIRFIVNGLIPTGLSILASPPKYGKSWMVLDLCLAVASGRKFLGYQVSQCGCLYLALEDSERRLKSRMNKLLYGREAPEGFHLATSAPALDGGLLESLDGFLATHRDVGLIVVDTLQRVRGNAHGREGAYAADYRELAALKNFADARNLALVLVHHLRKMGDDTDPFNRVSGTAGVTGAADTMFVISKEKRSDSTAKLSIVGRDVEGGDVVLQFDKASCKWLNMGDADTFAAEQRRRAYFDDPIVITVKRLLEQKPTGWTGSSKDLLAAGTYIAHTQLASTSQELAKRLASMTELFLDVDGIIYEARGNGNGGRRHSFSYRRAFEELDGDEESPFLID